MLPYWILFLFPAFAALRERPARYGTSARNPAFFGGALLLALLIGFRYQVGGDWGSYIGYLYRAKYLSIADAITSSDPGYIIINWLAAQATAGVWFVNLICGLVFVFGLAAFARSQPRPWLALVVAVPYLVIVVAMGYSRQGVAIGLAMLGLVALTRDRSNVKFVIWIALAASFHKSAVLLVPLAALSSDRGRIWTALWIGASTVLLYYLFLQDSVETLISGYITAEYQSQGAAIRVTMNTVPAILFLVFRRRFKMNADEQRLWRNVSLLALGFVLFLILSPSSTAVDRMALYIIPLQIMVLSRLPSALASEWQSGATIVFAVVAYSAAVQFVWLNFAAHSQAWIPYRIYPLL